MSGRARVNEVKVVLLGDMGVGKSSIALRLVHDQFNANSVTTVGAVCWTKSVSTVNGPVKLQLWDTAGQERYHALAPLYYRGASVAVVVYDITRRETFNTLKQWVSELRMQGPANILIAVVGNKKDVCDADEKKRDVEASMGQAFATEIGGIFAETSAKTSGGGIAELFEEVGNKLPALPSQGEKKDVVAVDKRPVDRGGAGGGQQGKCGC